MWLRGFILGFIVALVLTTQVQQPVKETVVTQVVEVEKVIRIPVLFEPSRGVYQREFEMVATAYTYSGDEEDLTFMELPVDAGVIAVDPNVIPLGSLVWVEGYGYAIAADTGNRNYISGNRIDIFLQSEKEAKQWGVRKVKVNIIR